MKKLFAIIICLALLAAACTSLISCRNAKTTNPIDFGKKYIYSEDRYYVFEADQTGYCEYKYTYEFSNASLSYTKSGRVDFVWREASDGAVYLFRTETHYYDDHTEGNDIPLIENPIYFSEDFFTYVSDHQYGSASVFYVKEGSDLEKLIKE